MRQHIDTAPVWEAYREGSECPLCALERESEDGYVQNFLGGSVMEPAVRVEVNEKGFCAAHFRMLYDAGNRLSLALMAHTHLKETIARIERREHHRPKLAPLSRARAQGEPPEPVAGGCILCGRLEAAMARYEETLLYMWAHEPAFREAFAGSKGLCVRHYARLAALAPASLPGRDQTAFDEALKRVTLENLRRVEKDLEWFTLKFDYRNQDKPWGESKDAVERALNKLRSNAVRARKDEAP